MKSLAELKAIRDRMQGEVNMREDDNSHHIRVVVGMATCGIASGARPVLNKLAEDVQAIFSEIYNSPEKPPIKDAVGIWTMLLLHRQVVLDYVSMNRL